MKKLLTLVLACILLLSLSSAAFAEPATVTFKAEEAELNLSSNTIAVQLEDDGYYQLISSDGEIIVPASEQYTKMDAQWDMPFFTVEKDTGDVLRCEGFMAGDGTVLVPAKYFMTDYISDDWQVGYLVTDAAGEDYDFVLTYYDDDATECYYDLETADFYYKGEYVGSLNYDECSTEYCCAYGAYLGVYDRAGNHVFYNSKMERSPYEATYFEEFDEEYDLESDQYLYYHQGSGQQAFVPECTLDPDDLENPYLYLDGVLYDITGQEIVRFPHEYDDYSYEFLDGYCITELEGKAGVITLKGEELVPFEYDSVGFYEDHPFRFGYISAVKDGMFGFLDAKGQPTGDFVYPEDEVSNYTTFATIKDENDATAVISAAVGTLPETYTYVYFPSQEGCTAFVAVKEDGTMGVVDLYGNVLVPFGGYYDIDVSLDGTTALVNVDYETFIIYSF